MALIENQIDENNCGLNKILQIVEIELKITK